MTSLPPELETLARLIQRSAGSEVTALAERIARLEAEQSADQELFETKLSAGQGDILRAFDARFDALHEAIRDGISQAEQAMVQDRQRWETEELPRRVREILHVIRGEERAQAERDAQLAAMDEEARSQRRREVLFWGTAGAAALGWILHGYQTLIVDRNPAAIPDMLRGYQNPD